MTSSETGSETAAMLETRGLCKNFGALEVARDVNFRLERGARHAVGQLATQYGRKRFSEIEAGPKQQ